MLEKLDLIYSDNKQTSCCYSWEWSVIGQDAVQGMFGHDECALCPDYGGNYMDLGVYKIHCNAHWKCTYITYMKYTSLI